MKFDQEAEKSVEDEDGDLLTNRNLDRALRLDEVDDEFERIKRRRKKPGVAIAMQVIFHFYVTAWRQRLMTYRIHGIFYAAFNLMLRKIVKLQTTTILCTCMCV